MCSRPTSGAYPEGIAIYTVEEFYRAQWRIVRKVSISLSVFKIHIILHLYVFECARTCVWVCKRYIVVWFFVVIFAILVWFAWDGMKDELPTSKSFSLIHLLSHDRTCLLCSPFILWHLTHRFGFSMIQFCLLHRDHMYEMSYIAIRYYQNHTDILMIPD